MKPGNIFVTVGTHAQQFDRLLKKMDELIASKKVTDNVFAQIGNSTHSPKNYEYKKFLTDSEYEEFIKSSDIIIAHAGAGTILKTLAQNKPLVVVPRLKEFREHTNDHQLDLAKQLEKQEKAIGVQNIDQLWEAIQKAKTFKPKTSSDKQKLIQKIQEFIENESAK